MPTIGHRRAWEKLASRATPQQVYLNRRTFLAALGAGSIGATLVSATVPQAARGEPVAPPPAAGRFDLARPATEAASAAQHTNFYEFGIAKTDAARRAGAFKARPWTIDIAGLVRRPGTIDLDELLQRMPQEQRTYRFRCVEAWAMVVPWTGFPLKKLIDHVEPLASATHVRMTTAHRPEEMPGIKEQPWYPWPYVEGLTMAEATNELTLLATGIYGKPLPVQHGAPLRLVVPWKYGYKSIKSVTRIEFVQEQPATFWTTLRPQDYPFEANVNPAVPHSRWSQSHERLIDTGEIHRTQMYNGYGEFVAHLYSKGG
jgi:methionine sulfoxide reductase catalytic subunit